MGLTLMPDATPDDGLLDGVVFHQRSIIDWASVAWSVLTCGRSAHRLMPRFRGRVIEVRTDVPQPVEVDGDVIGEALVVRFHVQARGLHIHRPVGRVG
jgi:diacylglycerol kinase (ATP)